MLSHYVSKNLKTSILAFVIVGFLVQCAPPEKTREVVFLKQTPIIDGKLDANLTSLPVKQFTHFFQFDNPETTPAIVTYRLGYTQTHLYVYIETDADNVSYHRRGYIYGDGYRLLLGIPQKTALTNEYYDLTFSPTLEPDYMWAKQRISGYNFSQETKKLSEATRSQENSSKGKSGFEALIAWTDIEPYHPWFLDQIGFNLYFAKGIDSKEHGYFTNGYAVVEDEGIWDEEIERRNYSLLSFEAPANVTEKIVISKLQKQHLNIGEPLAIKMVSIGPKTNRQKINFSLSDASGETVFKSNVDVDIGRNKTTKIISLETGVLPVGKYSLITENGGETYRTNVTIIPDIDFESVKKQILQNSHQLSMGTVNTLFFKLTEIEGRLSNLKTYETGDGIWSAWNLFAEELGSFETGVDPYENRRDPYRRAFKSKYDGTYQPYTVKLPENYNADKTYPLLVFMHGSGRDEQGLLDRPRSNGKFIELAPYARDKFRAYASPESQKDIVEAINDVIKNFSVNEDQIVMGGFSMGGYGALRAFYENPDLYKGVAVFAGHPNLASEWLGEDHPNFLDETYLPSFSNTPVFIYHGRKDAGLDVNLIDQMSIKLTNAGAKVTKSIVEENGHEYQDEKTNKLYFAWLDRTVEN